MTLSKDKQRESQDKAPPSESRSPRVGVALLLTDPAGTRVLLGRRGKEPNRGLWVVPGGGIECGETWRSAGVRELREETGLVVEITSEPIVVELPGNVDHRVILAARARAIGGVPGAGDDLLDLGYFAVDDLPSITASAREMLSRLGFTSGERASQEAPPATALSVEMQEEITKLTGALRAARFSPLGDNHHNAAACPHCGDLLGKAITAACAEVFRQTQSRQLAVEVEGAARSMFLASVASAPTAPSSNSKDTE